MSRPGVRLVRCPFQQWRSSTPFSSAAVDRRWRAQASEPHPESRTRPGARKKEKQENGAHAQRTEIRYCDVIENSWRGRITIGVKMVAASFLSGSRTARLVDPARIRFPRVPGKRTGPFPSPSYERVPKINREKIESQHRPTSRFSIPVF